MPTAPRPLRPSRAVVAPHPTGGVVLGRRAVGVAATLAVVALLWAGAATWYIASRDELAQRFFANETELRYGYEDRIAELKGRLEREITLNLVERNGFAARTEALATRQREIEARQAWLTGLAERLRGDGSGSDASKGRPATPETAAAGASPRDRAPESKKPAPVPEALELRPTAAPAEQRDRLSALERSLGDASLGAIRSAEMIRSGAAARAARLRTALDATGLEPRRALAPATGSSGPAGGPLVPLPPGFDAGVFAPLAAQAEARLAELDGLLATARTLPLRRPLAGELEPTSGFGYRLDPFTRGPALHTGADFRAEAGSAVLATGRGRVVSAEYAGGYGNLVEIDHGGGLTTRYGHLSAFGVAPGAAVEAGQVVGLAGSTGRSTGAHLHYETRIGGEPVNPARFLEAGRLLDGADTAR